MPNSKPLQALQTNQPKIIKNKGFLILFRSAFQDLNFSSLFEKGPKPAIRKGYNLIQKVSCS